MKKSIQSDSLKTTQTIAKELATTLLKSRQRRGAFVLALQGELGAGKTSFVQGLARGLGVKANVLSPTFLIVKSYPLSQGRTFWHIDCYRLESPKDLLQLGFREILKDPNNIVAVEWAERVKSIVPKDTLWISFFHSSKLTRRDIIVGE